MKVFYSAAEIEELASQGVRELVVDDDMVLTLLAREAAARLGIRLVAAGQAGPSAAAQPTTPPASPLKPRGCQHGLAADGPSARPCGEGGSASPVVGDLIEAVRRLAKQG